MVERCLWLLLFYGMQIGAYLSFKFGSTAPSRWIPCFIVGNILGISCMWIMMRLYCVMNANVATGMAIGGGFLCGQLSLALVFQTGLSVLQYCGIVITTIGLFVLAKG
jgi:hypothetical protein